VETAGAQSTKTILASRERLAAAWNKIVLPPQVKTDLLDIVEQFACGDAAAPRGLLLYGPPGSGKTLVLRCIADSLDCKFMHLNAGDLSAGYVGQTTERVRTLWRDARASGCCVMGIDWFEGVFPARGGRNSDSLAQERVTAFLTEWDGFPAAQNRGVLVIGETYDLKPVDPAILSRFRLGGRVIELPLPGTALERLQILSLELEKIGRTAEIPAFVGAATEGMSGRNLASLVYKACMQAEMHGVSALSGELAWRAALDEIRPKHDRDRENR
jgi:transitional endoplasmic reticulum ATPase